MASVTRELQAAVDQLNAETCSVYEAVALAGLSHTTIRKRIRQKRLRCVKLFGNYRVWTADLSGLK
ncbi:MAG: hypothetical protein QOC62_1776 [Mycobacterium sp.]|jgi:hypothetical protein|nr:hypothetical protein [Mycobacterium sp.]